MRWRVTRSMICRWSISRGVTNVSGDAFLARAAGAADPVHVAFRILRQVEVDDVRDPGDVKPARRDVRRDEHVDAAVAELAHDGIALILRQVAVQSVSGIAALLQRFAQLVHAALRAAEHDRQIGRFHVEQTAEHFEFLPFMHFDIVSALWTEHVTCSSERPTHAPDCAGTAVASFWMFGGIVAENSIVWRSSGS